MLADDALDFCRRRLAVARDRVSDLDWAFRRLQEDDADAERAWDDGRARDLRSRDLHPHRDVAGRQRTSLLETVEADTQLLGALEEVARMDARVLAAITAAREGAQAADAAATDAMRSADAARAEVSSADHQCAHAEGLCAGLLA